MRVDLKPSSEDGPENETLRSILRQWEVPATPPKIEEELRRTFRRRRPRGRYMLWLAVAASLVLLLFSPLQRRERPLPVSRPEPPRRGVTPLPLPSPRASLDRERLPAPAAPPRRSPRTTPRQAGDEVVVEPGQHELLIQFGHRLQDLRAPTTVFSNTPVEVVPAGAPERPILTVQAAEVPRYEADWERLAGVWPLVQLSAPTRKR